MDDPFHRVVTIPFAVPAVGLEGEIIALGAEASAGILDHDSVAAARAVLTGACQERLFGRWWARPREEWG